MNSSTTVGAIGVSDLPKYAKVPMTIEVSSRLKVEHFDNDLKGILLTQESVDLPYTKQCEDPNDLAVSWATKWDLTNWGLFASFQGKQIIGGCAVAYRTAGLHMLEDRDDIAVLWDIRIQPKYQRTGIGTRLFDLAKKFAEERRCGFLKIETQNVNVPACRFYQKQGCHLGGIQLHAYKEYPDEIQLLWYYPIKESIQRIV